MVLQERSMREAHCQRLKYRGVFDLDGFLRALRQWIIDRGYEFHEKEVKYKVPNPAGAELEIAWEGWMKITSYVKFWIKVAFHMWDVKDVEVIKEGKKVKLSNARMLMEIWGQVDLDYTNRFKGSRFAEALQDFYHKYVIHKDIDNVWDDELYYRVYKLYSFAKQYLEMEAAHNAAELRW